MTENIKKEKGHFRRNWLFYFLLLGVSGFSGYLWISKNIALHNQEKPLQQKRLLYSIKHKWP